MDTSMLPYGVKSCAVLAKRLKQRLKQTALDRCYAQVDARDNGISWVSGKQLVKVRHDPDRWWTRHHLAGRWGEHAWAVHEVITVSWTEHQLLQQHALIPVTASGKPTKDARRIHRFVWNRRMVASGAEPFRLPALAKRRG